MSALTARTAAEKLIDRLGITAAPVDVDAIAAELGLSIVREDLGSEISALLVTHDRSSVIGVHSGHSKTRRRFSIAHEIGHFVLRHQFEQGEHVHVDQGRFVSERSARASAGVDPKEIEANHFAAALLMPTKLVREHVGQFGRGPLLESEISQLAKDFEVSEQAMTIRLSTLSLI
jgi:Zn-dependent peptidase ImmA (M78 family)